MTGQQSDGDSDGLLEALRLSQMRFNFALKSTRITVLTIDRDLRITWVHNPNSEPDQVDLIGKRDDDLMPSEQAAPIMAFKRRVLATGIGGCETFAAHFGGTSLSYEVTLEALRDKNDDIVGLMAAAMDVSDRMFTEQEIRLRHERARMLSQISARLLLRRMDGERRSLVELLESVFTDIAVYLGTEMYLYYTAENDTTGNASGVLKLASSAGLDAATRASAAEVAFDSYPCGQVAQLRQPVIVEDMQRQHRDHPFADSRLVALGAQSFAGYPLLADGRLNGTLAFASAIRTHFPTEDREFLQAVADLVAVAVDRDRLAADVRDSESRFRMLADNMAQLAWTADPDHSVTWFNREWLEYTGTRLEDNLGQGWRNVQHPDYVDRVAERFEKHLREGREWEDTFPLRGKDGQYRWFLSRMKVIRDDDGAVVRFLGTNTDVTEQLQASERLRELTAELSESNRRKDEFLATLAHELRNPLAPVRNAVQVLRLKGPKVPELQWARDVIDRQTQAMARLIDDLMDVSRVSQGKLDLRRERVELHTIVQGAVEASRPHIEQFGHTLHVHLPEHFVFLDGDLTRLTQVIMNLLNNAAKYSQHGGVIELRATQHADEVVIVVSDTGIGIAADKLPGIFEMFSQVESALSRSQGGLGVGLSLVKRLVEMHGGTITAHSSGLGDGSQFVMRLPTVNVPADRMVTAKEDGKAAASQLRILVVDDNEDGADSLTELLTFLGNDVHTAYDGVQAVEMARRFQPDVILLDIGLPKLNGYEACTRIREEAHGRPLTIIAQTGWGQDEDRRRSTAAGFDHHLVKPVDPKALISLLSELPT